MSDRKTAALVRKLHGWELLHLREHAATLEAQVIAQAEEIERLRGELSHAEDCASSWRDDVMRLMEDDGMQLGLTQGGQIVNLARSAPRVIPVTAGVVLAKGSGPGIWNRWSSYCGGRRVMRAHLWGRYTQ